MSGKRIRRPSRRAWVAFALLLAGAVSAETPDIPSRHDPLPGITTAGQPSVANLLLHCASANRAGALRARRSGADSAAAPELGIASGLTGLKPAVEKKLAEACQ